jgi:hypothetical protein
MRSRGLAIVVCPHCMRFHPEGKQTFPFRETIVRIWGRHVTGSCTAPDPCGGSASRRSETWVRCRGHADFPAKKQPPRRGNTRHYGLIRDRGAGASQQLIGGL